MSLSRSIAPCLHSLTRHDTSLTIIFPSLNHQSTQYSHHLLPHRYASAYYGPFRDALDSHPGFGDKKTYQQDPANGREAIVEAHLDVAEGADMLMVKPGMPYLDVILRLRQETNMPIAAYHVSGEYAMLKAAAERGWLDEKKAVKEAMVCFKRAGCDVILTYYAKDVAQWIKDEGVF